MRHCIESGSVSIAQIIDIHSAEWKKDPVGLLKGCKKEVAKRQEGRRLDSLTFLGSIVIDTGEEKFNVPLKTINQGNTQNIRLMVSCAARITNWGIMDKKVWLGSGF